MMRTVFRRLGFALVIIYGSIVNATAQDFLPGSDAIPVMDGLNLVQDALVQFDAPEGHFMSVSAVGSVTEHNIMEFYSEVLLNLGWTISDPNHFERNGDHLSVFVDEGDMGSDTEVRFELIVSGS